MIRTRRRFDREFKLKVVELSYSRHNMKELASEFDLRPELIYRWRNE
ncbi:MAG: transposase, partial [Bacteroidetes bacterium]|nr:transposase [Bacteroidota bacterium]